MQDELIRITANLLKEADEKRKAGGSTDYTTFDIDSLVLVSHRTSKPTRTHTLWKGPMQVVANDLDEYTQPRRKIPCIKYWTIWVWPYKGQPNRYRPTRLSRVLYRRYPSNGREHPGGGNIKISRQVAKLSPRQKHLGTVEKHAWRWKSPRVLNC